MWQVTRHRKGGEEEMAEQLMGMMFGLIASFFKRPKSEKDKQTKPPTPAPEMPYPEAEERARIADEFDIEVDPEAPGDNTLTRAKDNRIKIIVPGARQR